MILLDTNALIWLEQGHSRTRLLRRRHARLYVSPASLLELQYLREAGRIRLRSDLDAIAADDRWLVDDPSPTAWFTEACEVAWTRDPFDRLLVAHALLRGWRLATGDEFVLGHLPASTRLAL